MWSLLTTKLVTEKYGHYQLAKKLPNVIYMIYWLKYWLHFYSKKSITKNWSYKINQNGDINVKGDSEVTSDTDAISTHSMSIENYIDTCYPGYNDACLGRSFKKGICFHNRLR